MRMLLKNWKNTMAFGVIYAIVSTFMLTLLSMHFEQIIKTVFLSTFIVMVLINYIGVFKNNRSNINDS